MMGEFPDCEVKLVDFEISRYIDPERDIVDFLGTPDYVGENTHKHNSNYYFEIKNN